MSATAPNSAAPVLDVLIPTCNRAAALAVTLACLFAQTLTRFRVVISDQSEQPVEHSGEVQAVLRALQSRAIETHVLRHLPRRGLAEQRAFLLAQAQAAYVLYLDDDLVLEAGVLQQMLDSIQRLGCGFVGCAVHGLSYVDDVRPHEQAIELWQGPITPEKISPQDAAWQRHRLHSAANLWHVQQQLAIEERLPCEYRVAWVGACVLYDRSKLLAAGGFDFWRDLPASHCGEDVLAQLRVMARDGGCGLLPSGVYHQELPTTVNNRQIDAPLVLAIHADEQNQLDESTLPISKISSTEVSSTEVST